MTDSQEAAAEIWRWVGSAECEALVHSDMPECAHDKPKHTTKEVDELCVLRIRQIIDKHLC